jgi:uncharacterized delta-60 repeat protein
LPGRVEAISDQLDPTFGDGGKVVTDFSGLDDFPAAMVVQPDGKAIVVGFSRGADFSNFATARYKPNGTLDDSFGAGGMVFNPNFNRGRHISDVTILPDGKIMTGWYSGALDEQGYSPYGFVLSRYHAEGTLDSTFGTGGIADSAPFGRGVGIEAIIEPDGQILF